MHVPLCLSHSDTTFPLDISTTFPLDIFSSSLTLCIGASDYAGACHSSCLIENEGTISRKFVVSQLLRWRRHRSSLVLAQTYMNGLPKNSVVFVQCSFTRKASGKLLYPICMFGILLALSPFGNQRLCAHTACIYIMNGRVSTNPCFHHSHWRYEHIGKNLHICPVKDDSGRNALQARQSAILIEDIAYCEKPLPTPW